MFNFSKKFIKVYNRYFKYLILDNLKHLKNYYLVFFNKKLNNDFIF